MNSTVLWYTSRATGLVALLLLTATMVLGILTANRASTRNWPAFSFQELHKRIALMSVALVAIHVLTSILDTYVNIGWASVVVPFSSHYDRSWVAVGTIGVDLMIAVTLSSLLRHRLGARTWRALHWLAYLSWPIALAHAFGMGTDMGEGWALGLATSCIAAVAAAVSARVYLHVVERRRAFVLATAPSVVRHLPSRRRAG